MRWLSTHGYTRATGNIDLWICVSDENAEKVWRALQSFGAPLFDPNINDLKTPGIVFQMGVVPNRIDIINKIEAVSFDGAWADHNTVNIEGLEVPLIGKTQLLANKRALGRPTDQLDVLWMESE